MVWAPVMRSERTNDEGLRAKRLTRDDRLAQPKNLRQNRFTLHWGWRQPVAYSASAQRWETIADQDSVRMRKSGLPLLVKATILFGMRTKLRPSSAARHAIFGCD